MCVCVCCRKYYKVYLTGKRLSPIPLLLVSAARLITEWQHLCIDIVSTRAAACVVRFVTFPLPSPRASFSFSFVLCTDLGLSLKGSSPPVSSCYILTKHLFTLSLYHLYHQNNSSVIATVLFLLLRALYSGICRPLSFGPLQCIRKVP